MSRTVKRASSLSPEHASRAEAAFAKLHDRFKAVTPAERTQPNVDMQDAGTAALGILKQLASHDIHARLEKLAKAGEFRLEALDELEQLAWAAIHVRRKLLLKLGTNSAAQVPADVASKATEVRNRMAGLCRYYFGDVAAYAATIAYLEQGNGYLDTANDLEGYADIYRAEPDTVRRDAKYFRATDASDARELAQQIYTFLGVGAGGNEPDWGTLQGAVWPLLTRTYEEVRRAGRLLFYYDSGDERFPSLVTAARATPGRNPDKEKEKDKGEAAPAPTPAPAPAKPDEPKP